jgi:hypothetical protein
MNENTIIEPSVSHPSKNVSDSTRRFIRAEKIAPAFWTIASILSLVVNLILLVVVFVLAGQLFNIKQIVNQQLIGGLYKNFVLMDQAHIRTTIPIKTSVPAKFSLPLKTQTQVTLTKDTLIQGARVSLYGGVVSINDAPTDIILPAGTILPVQLDLSVPVDQQIPVELQVNVDIPLSQTDLHAPFTGLQQVLNPYYSMLNGIPNSWSEIMCDMPASDLCKTLFP